MSNTRRPKAVTPLPPPAVDALRARVEASNISHAARELAVSDGLVARALRGEGVTPAIHRLLTLQLAPDGAVTARARTVTSTATHDSAAPDARHEAHAA